jgi:hypothetical protein
VLRLSSIGGMTACGTGHGVTSCISLGLDFGASAKSIWEMAAKK